MENYQTPNLAEKAQDIFKSLNVATHDQAAEFIKTKSAVELANWYFSVLCVEVGKLDTEFRRKVFAYIEKARGKPIGANESRREILDNNAEYRAVMDTGIEIIYEKLNEFQAYPEFIEKMNEYKEIKKEEQRQKDLHISVEGSDYKASEIIPVLWQGWELDDKAWIVEIEGKSHLVTTSHGQASWTNVSFLEEKLKEYELAAQATREAIEKLKKSSE